jgi:hypothetical protein
VRIAAKRTGRVRVSRRYFNSSIPANLTDIFSSATSNTTLSGAFNIQYRTWAVTVDSNQHMVDRGLPYPISSYRTLDLVILHNKTEAVEGVVVDTVNGGVGYRNHTIPTGLPYGGNWTEELTWIEPVTSCVDTNLTFLISMGGSDSISTSVSLVDNGGFANLPRHLPYQNQLEASQNPDLYVRAYQGAWITNVLTMFYLNVSYPNNTGPRNTSIGRQFPLGTSYEPSLYSIGLSGLTPTFLDLAIDNYNTSTLNLSSAAKARLSLTSQNFTDAQELCQGWSASQRPSISTVEILCGYLYGAPRPADGSNGQIFQPFSKWTQSLYVCATGIRSSVKTVGFSINDTSSLADLRVTSVEDKVYRDNASKPLWALERTFKSIADVEPLWGMVADRYESAKDLVTLRAEKFWVPAVNPIIGVTSTIDSLAAPVVFGAALSDLFTEGTSYDGFIGLADYSGRNNMALNRLWQTFSQSSATAGRIINLIYTDIVATATVGTKSAILPSSPLDLESPNTNNRVVRYMRQLQYNMLYAIPALLILLITVAVVVVALPIYLLSHFSMTKFSRLLNQTSTGRVATNLLYPDLCAPDAPTSAWIPRAGVANLELPFKGASKAGAAVEARMGTGGGGRGGGLVNGGGHADLRGEQPSPLVFENKLEGKNEPCYRAVSQTEDMHEG